MIFFVAMPMVIGLMNLVVPLQIGARDVAFPFLNNLSFWLFAVSAILVNISLVVGEFAKTGWLAYAPLSGIEFSPGVGVDYWILALQISGIGTTLTGIDVLLGNITGGTLLTLDAQFTTDITDTTATVDGFLPDCPVIISGLFAFNKSSAASSIALGSAAGVIAEPCRAAGGSFTSVMRSISTSLGSVR